MKPFDRSIINSRRDRLSKAWSNSLQENDCVLIFCGEPQKKPGGLDQTYPFLSHPSYFWISGLQKPSGVVFYSHQTGWIDFVRPITAAEKVWEGSESEFSIDFYKNIEELDSFLKKYNFSNIVPFGEVDLIYKKLSQNVDQKLIETLKLQMDSTRRIKDSAEVDLIIQAANIANKGYEKIRKIIQPGMTEKELQIEFEAEIQRHGAHKVPYESIVGAGSRAAILHAIPTDRKILKQDLVLIDAGVDLYDYCVDITRVYSAGKKFSDQQQALYSIVLKAQENGITKAVSGTEWKDVHEVTARVIADGLKQLNLVSGSVDSIISSGAIAVFYPHGVGHLVGLRVRDTGCEENKNPQKHCGVTLRVDMKIKEGHILTVEPGCYFIQALLDDKKVREQFKDQLNWSEIEKWKNIGGVRIEDDILITDSAPKNLTEVVSKSYL